MATRTHKAPPKGEQAQKAADFKPRPFGETEPASPSEPVPDPQEQIERAERFGHNLTHVSVSSSGEAPIQGMFSLFGGGKSKDKESRKPLLQGSDSSSGSGSGSYTPPVYVPPRPSPVRASAAPSPSGSVQIGPLPAPKPSVSPVVVPKIQPPPSAPVSVAPPVPVEDPAVRAKRLAREADRTKLSGMFNVTDELDIFDSSPNRISTKEFGEISELYSKIREDDSNIKFANQTKTGASTSTAMSGPEFATFKDKGLDDIAKILQTPQGRTVLKSLGAGGKTGTSTFTIGGVSATGLTGAGPTDGTTASNGTGSGGSVHYSPGTELSLVQGSATLPTTSDTALFHELLHNYHYGQGTRKTGTIDAISGALMGAPLRDVGVNEEEYATVGLGNYAGDALTENAYRASHTTLAGGNQALKDKYKKRVSYL